MLTSSCCPLLSFKQAQPHEIESIDDGQVMHDLLNIRNWNYDCLLDLSIIPGRKSKEELFRLYMLTTLIHANMGAIAQFKDGIDMVSRNLLKKENYEKVKSMLEFRQVDYTFDQIIKLINYTQLLTTEEGSNNESNLRECISEFELILIEMGQHSIMIEDDIPLCYSDLLFFITGCDRIPSYGFGKKIDVDFTDISLPKSHSCALSLHMTNVPKSMLRKLLVAIRYGGGYGVI